VGTIGDVGLEPACKGGDGGNGGNGGPGGGGPGGPSAGVVWFGIEVLPGDSVINSPMVGAPGGAAGGPGGNAGDTGRAGDILGY
jgi:hypothetical protein